ncbi:MAG TPA: superinfection immunity protein [Candidatus Binatia bacterium]|nr:superinfection immunity protein [Candidatus Binatia bacterium]
MDHLFGLLFVVALYFLPWLVAASRRHRNRLAIAVANFFLGWTVIGWIGTLIWASTADVEPKR